MAQDNEVFQGVQHDPLHFIFFCPGCDEPHQVKVNGNQTGGYAWQWNGDKVKPTLAPSVLLRSGHYAGSTPSGSCWCTYNAAHPDEPSPFICSVCHSFVTDGNIQYLTDCTHALAGQTVPLPTWNSKMGHNDELST